MSNRNLKYSVSHGNFLLKICFFISIITTYNIEAELPKKVFANTNYHDNSDILNNEDFLAGAEESWLKVPIGTPLAGYTDRWSLFSTPPDERTSPYTTAFSPSFGVQTRIPIKVICFESNNNVLFWIKVDLAYAFDGLLFQIEDSISASLGIDVSNKVILSTSHSHSSYGAFSHDPALFLGGDQDNTHLTQQIVDQVAETSLNAYQKLTPASIGVGFDFEFDPIGVDKIYKDRRVENDELTRLNGEVSGAGYKDTTLTLIRIDASNSTESQSDDTPIAVIESFGIHGTVGTADNWLLSVDAPGFVELKTQEKFLEKVVVMHIQGPAGDQSPVGVQSNFSRMESIGELAAPKIYSLWEQVQTSSAGVSFEFLTRSIIQDSKSMLVSRMGTSNFYYSDNNKRYTGDDIVYNEDGSVNPVIDEFFSDTGAVLCSGDPSLEIVGNLFGWNTSAYPYNTCGNVDELIKMLDKPFFKFDLGWVSTPLQTAQSTVISLLRFNGLPVYKNDTNANESVVFGIFPGEPLALYADYFQYEMNELYSESNSELNIVTVGYSQDHEGYLMTVEDWLKGGYEAEINQWGPLQGEYILEQMLILASQFGIDDPSVPESSIGDPKYTYYLNNEIISDITKNAGNIPNELPEYLYTYNQEIPTTAQPKQSIERLTGIASFVWEGGDPEVDLPFVWLEKEKEGIFEKVMSPGKREWSNATGEIILTYTPYPLSYNKKQHHYWSAFFQAVTDEPSISYSASLATGGYRFCVEGNANFSNSKHKTLKTRDIQTYSTCSDTFYVTEQENIEITPSYADSILTIKAAYPESPSGYRLIAMQSDGSNKTHPLNSGENSSAKASIKILSDLSKNKNYHRRIAKTSGDVVFESENVNFKAHKGYSQATISNIMLPAGNYTIELTDIFGNKGIENFTITQ